MHKKLKHSLKWLLFFITATFFTSCLPYEDVELKAINNLKIDKFSTKGANIEVDAVIYNPNFYKITIQDSDLDLFIDGKEFGKASVKQKIVMPGKEEKSHHFVVNATMQHLIQNGLSTMIGMLGNEKVHVELKGEVKGKALFLSRKFPVNISQDVEL